MGAKVTGVDFSEKAIERARELAKLTNVDTQFILSDVYSLKDVLKESFDIVFTSYGTIGWLPDINRWASIVSYFLRPGGHFVFAEFHPFIWTLSEDFQDVKYRYFNSEPIVDESDVTYTDGLLPSKSKSVGWNHALSEVIQALIAKGLDIKIFQEFDYSPYDCFDNIIEMEKGKFQIKGIEGKIPMVYALKAVKKA